MDFSLEPVLDNIIMTELEDVFIKPLIADGTIKFYSRFIIQVHEALNKFDSNLRFTVDTFQNEVFHFLDLEL